MGSFGQLHALARAKAVARGRVSLPDWAATRLRASSTKQVRKSILAEIARMVDHKIQTVLCEVCVHCNCTTKLFAPTSYITSIILYRYGYDRHDK
jgi:hypothetical protein